VGAGALLIAKDVPEPTTQQQLQAMPGQRQELMRENGPMGGPDQGPDQSMRPDQPFPPPPDDGGPGGPDRLGGSGPRAGRNAPHQPPLPPIAVPAVENWHRAQAMRTIGLLSLACGAVLLMLGIVRIAFSAVERVAADETRG
jgi:hypothetical protein